MTRLSEWERSRFKSCDRYTPTSIIWFLRNWALKISSLYYIHYVKNSFHYPLPITHYPLPITHYPLP
ncbi:MAG TPA: hypothetical protein V6D26_05025, partial [Stenomitos sp.]